MAQAPGGTHILPEDQPLGFANGAFGGLSLCSLGPEQCFQEHRGCWAEGLGSDPWGAVALDPQCGGLGLCLWGTFTHSTIQSITPNLLLSILLCSVTLNSISHNGLRCCSPFSSYIFMNPCPYKLWKIFFPNRSKWHQHKAFYIPSMKKFHWICKKTNDKTGKWDMQVKPRCLWSWLHMWSFQQNNITLYWQWNVHYIEE